MDPINLQNLNEGGGGSNKLEVEFSEVQLLKTRFVDLTLLQTGDGENLPQKSTY